MHVESHVSVSRVVSATLDMLAAFYNVFDDASSHKVLNRIFLAISLFFVGLAIFFAVNSVAA